MLRRIILLALFGMLLLGILFIKWREHGQKKIQQTDDAPVARVYDRYLYKSDLTNITADAKNPEDSVQLVEQYIQSWMAKQLLIAEAEAHSEYKKAEIERKVLDYRYALLVHNYIEKLVNAQLNREVSEQEIESYYQAHQGNFVLRYNIFKGKFIIIPKDAPNQARLTALLRAKGKDNMEALKSYCFQFAKDYALDQDIWLQWDELIQCTPFSKVTDKAKLLKNHKVLQTSDETYLYYFEINEYRTVNDTSPLEFIRSQIADIIIYKRKIDLANKIKEDILKQAKNNNHCVIYEH
jgi:hypothetical protein